MTVTSAVSVGRVWSRLRLPLSPPSPLGSFPALHSLVRRLAPGNRYGNLRKEVTSRDQLLQQRITGLGWARSQALRSPRDLPPRVTTGSDLGTARGCLQPRCETVRQSFTLHGCRRLSPKALEPVGGVGSLSRVKCPRCIPLLEPGTVTPSTSSRAQAER
jgi:hypothetical protein